MILLGWAVDGFGPLRDFRVDGLGPGLTVVVGPNEAGKSSLLAFLRFVLFGFLGREPRREPVHGGRHGGRIVVAVRPGGPAWTVERHADRRGLQVLGPDGRPAGEGDLRRLLGGADARVFRSVFAFGLWELSVMDSLTDEGVRDHIFSAGITGAGADVRRALRALEEEAAELWRPRAASRIGGLLSELEAATAALRAAQAAAAGYAALVERQEQQAERVRALAAELEELRGRQRRLERLLLAWPVWQRWRQAVARLGELPDPGDFPEQGLGRLEELLERRRQARLLVDKLRGQLRAWEAQPRLPEEAGPALEAVWADAAAQRQGLEGLPGLLAEVRRQEERLRAALAELGPGWSRERLAAGIGAVGLADALEGWGQRLRAVSEAARRAEDEAARAARAAEAAERQAGRWPADLPAPDEWRTRLQELRRSAAQAERGRSLLVVGACLAVAAGVLLAAGHPAWSAVPAALAAAAVLLGRDGLGLERARSALGAWQDMAADVEARAGALRALADAWAEVGRLRAEAERLAAEATAVEEQWRAWKAAQGLPAGLSPEGARVFVQALGRARDLVEDLARAEAALGERQKAVAEWEARARAAMERAGVPPRSGGSDLLAELAEVWRRWASEREEAQRAEAVRARLREAEADEGALGEQWAALMRAAGVWAEGEAEAEEAFRHRAEAARVRREAVEEERLRRGELEAVLGEGAAAEELRALLATGDADGWRGELEALQARIAAAEAERDAAAGALREAEVARRQLEEQADVARLGAEVEGLRAELAAAVRAWRVNATAQALLRRTLAEFMAARQPQVLRVASGALGAITGGRYRAVVQDESGESLHVVDAAGRRLAPEALSRGTAEQLYLAVRLGLAASFAAKAAPLPLVMDDVLVNFDPVRAAAAAEALAGFVREGEAEGRQVLLFTCHPETVRRLRAADPACRVVDMPAGPWAAVGLGVAEAAAATEAQGAGARPAAGGAAVEAGAEVPGGRSASGEAETGAPGEPQAASLLDLGGDGAEGGRRRGRLPRR